MDRKVTVEGTDTGRDSDGRLLFFVSESGRERIAR